MRRDKLPLGANHEYSIRQVPALEEVCKQQPLVLPRAQELGVVGGCCCCCCWEWENGDVPVAYVLVPAGQADVLNIRVGVGIEPPEEEVGVGVAPLADGDQAVADGDPEGLEGVGAAQAGGGDVSDGGSVDLDPEALVPVAAEDDSVVAAGVRPVVVAVAAGVVAEHQGDVVVSGCLEGDAATAGLPEAKLLGPGALERGDRQGSLVDESPHLWVIWLDPNEYRICSKVTIAAAGRAPLEEEEGGGRSEELCVRSLVRRWN